MKRIYISGKITGLELEIARDLFKKAEMKLKHLGFNPLNPMEEVPYNPDWSWEQYMAKDIELLITQCDAIYMLPNWTHSKGAMIEHYISNITQKVIIYEKENNQIG